MVVTFRAKISVFFSSFVADSLAVCMSSWKIWSLSVSPQCCVADVCNVVQEKRAGLSKHVHPDDMFRNEKRGRGRRGLGDYLQHRYDLALPPIYHAAVTFSLLRKRVCSARVMRERSVVRIPRRQKKKKKGGHPCSTAIVHLYIRVCLFSRTLILLSPPISLKREIRKTQSKKCETFQ